MEIAWVTAYSVSVLNCLHNDLHWTGVISVSFGETCVALNFDEKSA